MNAEGVRIERRGATLEIVLDRPPANAISAATSRALSAAFVALRNDSTLRVGIVTGGGERFFSAGWDLKAVARGDNDGGYGEGGFAGLTELFDLDKPVIAAVNGLAVGGGFELALAADIIVAADHAAFFLPEVTVGLIANGGGVFRLTRRLPHAIAMDMLLTGRQMPASEALARGLLNAVVPVAELLAAARGFAERVCRAAPLAVLACKEVVRNTTHLSLPDAYRVMRSNMLRHYETMLASDDYREGPRAFVEKRPPRWTGS